MLPLSPLKSAQEIKIFHGTTRTIERVIFGGESEWDKQKIAGGTRSDECHGRLREEIGAGREAVRRGQSQKQGESGSQVALGISSIFIKFYIFFLTKDYP